MDENELELLDSTNETETTENKEESAEYVEALKRENATLKAQKDHWKKKATEKPEPETSKSPEELVLTPKDTLALIEAKVSAEDFDEVIRVAKILGKTVAEAVKDKTLQSILRDRAEERQTAIAAQTKSPRGIAKPNGDELIEKANRGQLPDSEEDIDRLTEARMQARLKEREAGQS